MLSPRYFLSGIVIFVLGSASAAFAQLPAESKGCDHLDQRGLCRDGNDKIYYNDQVGALKSCPEGTHLPTVRELANESQARGAKGILEMSQVDPAKVPAGYFLVSAVNFDGRHDEFYFNSESYKRIGNDPNRSMGVWSSSHSSDSFFNGYFLQKELGGFDFYWTTGANGLAIQCFANQW